MERGVQSELVTRDPKELLDVIGITKFPARWEPLLQTELQKVAEEGCPAAEEAFLRELNTRYRLFGHRFELVLRAAAQIRGNPALMLYVRMLCLTAASRANIEEDHSQIALPQPAEGEAPLGYDLAPIFAVLPTVPESWRRYVSHGVDAETIRNTLHNYEVSIDSTEARTGRPGFALGYFDWAKHYVNANILLIGRLNFEMKHDFNSPVRVFRRESDGAVRILADGMKLHRSGYSFGPEGFDDEEGSLTAEISESESFWEGFPVQDNTFVSAEKIRLTKEEWSVALQKDDPTLSVHIPAGPGLTPAACEESYAEAAALFRRCYPEFNFRAFVCFSWLMDPQLAQMLRPESNITAFQRRYFRFPISGGTGGVFSFVFLRPTDRLEDLPENTSLERAVKAHYLAGKYIYTTGGVFFPGGLQEV